MKAPEYEEDGDQDGSRWSLEGLKYLYHRKELRDFVRQGPVMKILKLKRIAEPKDTVTAPAIVTNKLDAVTALIKLLKEAGMIPGSFETDDLFVLDLTVIQATSRDLFGKLKILVGEVPQIADPVSSPQIDVVDNLRPKADPAPHRNPGACRWDLQKYDPDDIDFPGPDQAAVATAASGSTGSTMIQRVRISAISDLKKFSGKDPVEDRARAWISKVKSALMRDQASDEGKCLTFADLLAGSAKNWYHQLSRSTRNKFDESSLTYLYRLNVAGLRVRLKLKYGSTKDRHEHVDHFIETLEDQDLADRLTLLRLSDADDLEEVLRARDRAKSRQKKAAFGYGKHRQKVFNAAWSALAKQVRAIRIQAVDSGSDSSDGSDGSDSEMDSHRRIYLAANQEVTPKEESETIMPDPGHQDPVSMNHIHQEHRSKIQSDDSDLGFKTADKETTTEITKPSRIAEYRRSASTLDLLPGESRGYWKYHAPGKWFRQAKIVGKIHNEKAILLLVSGVEVSIVDTAKDADHAGSLVYFFDIWVGDLSGQEAILGMDFMVPTGIRLDLAHGSISLPDEVRIQLSGRRQLYSDKARIVNLGQYLRIQSGESVELPLRLRISDHEKFWVTRGDHWVPTIVHGPGKIRYMRITDVGDKVLILHHDLRIGIWLAGNHFPRLPGFISARPDPDAEDPPRPAVEHAEYETPHEILQRPRPTAIKCLKGGSSGDQEEVSDHPPSDIPPSDNRPLDCRPLDVASVASDGSDLSSIADDDSMSHVVTVVKALDDQDPSVSGITTVRLALVEDPAVETVLADEAPSGVTEGRHVYVAEKDEDPAAVPEDQPDTSDLDLTWDSDQDYDKFVYYHEDSDLYAEDVDGQLAVLPEVPATTENVRIEDIQLCGSDNQTPEEIDRLHQQIWKFRHLLIGKGNALPPAARGVVCDIDVGGARPIALTCRRLRIQFREKLADS
ncbi:hypothetical protein PHMEG_0006402 [Phytophthora megakarya]|uniref:Eukaryotic/viral aspartic protease n=1 Tax=Phytophthora megakarya TaxID=4795 RepID=A0A225WNW7_9STRA|nr:hypothetical protein PHMEG_0006402 [Phytophthora megakarya]